MPYQRTLVGAFRGNAMELVDIFESLPPVDDKELLIFKAFNLDECFVKTIRQAVPSATLAFAVALNDFFDGITLWGTDLEDSDFMSSGPWSDSFDTFWSERKVVGVALHIPDRQEGGKECHYPLLWWVMTVDGY